MCKARIVAGVLCACALRVAYAIPFPGYYYPSGMQVGTSARIIVGGTSMSGVKGAVVSGGGVEVTRIVEVPTFTRALGRTQGKWVINWLYDILEGKTKEHRPLPPEALLEKTDWSECQWWPFLDERDDLELQIIARDRYSPPDYPQPTPALNKLLLLDITVKPDAEVGRRDIIIFDSDGASAPHSFYITKEPHVREKYFVIPPRKALAGYKLPDILHLPTEFLPLTPPIYIDGQDWPGEVDTYELNLKKGQHLVCALTGRELLPYLGDAVPGFFNPELRLRNSKGHRVAHADDFYYLPDPILRYTVPEDGIYKLEVCDNLYRGRSDFVYFVHCYFAEDERPLYTPQQRAFECFPPAASHAIPKEKPGRILKKGTLDYPGRVDRHYLEITEPSAWRFELFARRQGSPIDGVLKLYGPMGDLPLSATPMLAEWDDIMAKLTTTKNVGDDEHPIMKTSFLYVGGVPQVECDPYGTFNFLKPGKYCVTVSDRIGMGGEYYDYALCMEKLEPSFEVYAETSAFVEGSEDTGHFTAHVLRKDGWVGPITFDSTDDWLVEGEFEDDPKVTKTDVVVNYRGEKKLPILTRLKITATGTMPNGTKKTVTVTPCDSVEQAFAYTHFLPQANFFFLSPGDKSIKEPYKHPLPHLVGENSKRAKTTHSNGQACIQCHDKKNTKKHMKGKKDCRECHKNKD